MSIDLGFLVSKPPNWTVFLPINFQFLTAALHHIIQNTSQVTNKYGTEESKASVDYTVYHPSGEVLMAETGVSEGEYGGETKGGRGPWKVCFRVSSGALLRPSVTVQINYFLVSYEEYLGDSFDWEEGNHKLDPKDLGTQDQIESLTHGLLRLDHYLMNVTHEQRLLYSRTCRHLRTAESTLRRTFWYYLALYVIICMASFSQLVVVRLMFKKSRKQGLII